MRKRTEDKILAAVFEDEHLPVKLSAAEQRRVDEYQQIRMTLQLLKDVPEDQMSKERLRDAILNRGLDTPPPVAPRWRWQVIAMPLASFALAYIGMSVVNSMPATGKGGEARLVTASSDPIDQLRKPERIVRTIVNPRPNLPMMQPSAAPSGSLASLKSSSGSRRKSTAVDGAVKEQSAPILLASNETSRPIDSFEHRPAPKVEQSTPSLETVTLDSNSGAMNGPIVVIEPALSTEEPARATEISSGAHTLVGG
jgi:hypothetical protein